MKTYYSEFFGEFIDAEAFLKSLKRYQQEKEEAALANAEFLSQEDIDTLQGLDIDGDLAATDSQGLDIDGDLEVIEW